MLKLTKNLAVLCDYGLDDAVASIYLIENADKFETIDFLAVSGNFPLDISFNNLKKLLANYPKLPNNIRIVDTSSVSQYEENIPHIHGMDGMGDVLPNEYNYTGKTIAYNEWINGIDSSYTILSLGPCTVTLDIIQKHPNLSLVMMAGNIAEKPNYKGYEFNHGLDPEAFSECVKHNHFTATLDTCHVEKCDFNLINYNRSEYFNRFTDASIAMAIKRGDKGCYIYDLVAAVYLLHPEKFNYEVKIDNFGNSINVLKYTSDNFLI